MKIDIEINKDMVIKIKLLPSIFKINLFEGVFLNKDIDLKSINKFSKLNANMILGPVV